MTKANTYKLILVQEATDDMVELHRFYEEVAKGLGDYFLDQLGICFSQLEENPNIWQFAKTKAEGLRRGIVPKPQVIFLYTVEGKEVRGLSLKDAKSNWKT
ncbi:MAG: hypothetical protein AAFP92_03080 [Bacteroidota bacterium]